MTSRTTAKIITFSQPFSLRAMRGEAFPAGAYTVETDEELIEGLSFPAYRRTATWIRMPAQPGVAGAAQVIPIDPSELDDLETCISMTTDLTPDTPDQIKGTPQ